MLLPSSSVVEFASTAVSSLVPLSVEGSVSLELDDVSLELDDVSFEAEVELSSETVELSLSTVGIGAVTMTVGLTIGISMFKFISCFAEGPLSFLLT